jgi:hypothetical protein
MAAHAVCQQQTVTERRFVDGRVHAFSTCGVVVGVTDAAFVQLLDHFMNARL